jgi:hypothetical protein
MIVVMLSGKIASGRILPKYVVQPKRLPNTADGGYKYFGRQSYNGLAAFSVHPNQTLEYRLYGTVQASPLL